MWFLAIYDHLLSCGDGNMSSDMPACLSLPLYCSHFTSFCAGHQADWQSLLTSVIQVWGCDGNTTRTVSLPPLQNFFRNFLVLFLNFPNNAGSKWQPSHFRIEDQLGSTFYCGLLQTGHEAPAQSSGKSPLTPMLKEPELCIFITWYKNMKWVRRTDLSLATLTAAVIPCGLLNNVRVQRSHYQDDLLQHSSNC